MLPYVFTFLFLLMILMLDKYYLKSKNIFIPFLILVLFASLRSNTVGVDSYVYTYDYVFNQNSYVYGFKEDIEYGYQLLDYFILSLTKNYFWLFFLTSVLINFFYIKAIKKISEDFYFSIIFYFLLGFYTFYFNGLRQGIALSLSFYSLVFLIENKNLKFLSIVLFASLFHQSALIMFFVLIIYKIDVNKYIKFLISFFISFVFGKFLISYVSQNNQRYELYMEDSIKGDGFLTLMFYLSIGVFSCILGDKYLKDDKLYNKLLSIYLCGIGFIIPLSILGVDPSGPQRILYYFIFVSILFLPALHKKIKNLFIYLGVFIIFIVFFLLSTYKLGGFYPYQLNPLFGIL